MDKQELRENILGLYGGGHWNQSLHSALGSA